MSTALWGLIGFSILLLAYISVQGLMQHALLGTRWSAGPRDEPRNGPPLAGRSRRALANLLETAPAFVALCLVVELSGRDSVFTDWAIRVYLMARAIYLPLYLLGIPWLRSFAWNFATGALAVLLAGILIA